MFLFDLIKHVAFAVFCAFLFFFTCLYLLFSSIMFVHLSRTLLFQSRIFISFAMKWKALYAYCAIGNLIVSHHASAHSICALLSVARRCCRFLKLMIQMLLDISATLVTQWRRLWVDGHPHVAFTYARMLVCILFCSFGGWETVKKVLLCHLYRTTATAAKFRICRSLFVH